MLFSGWIFFVTCHWIDSIRLPTMACNGCSGMLLRNFRTTRAVQWLNGND